MRDLVILGGGTAGTMVANRMRRRLGDDWTITVVDRDDRHPYQPGYLFVPFDGASTGHLVRSRHSYIGDRIDFLVAEVDRIVPEGNVVLLADGRSLAYDYLVVATGVSPRPDLTPGVLGEQWRRSIFDLYTLDGAQALREALLRFDHGRLVVHVAETPIKCPVAPL